jgi:GNAT superfamily N-acetyltransferase
VTTGNTLSQRSSVVRLRAASPSDVASIAAFQTECWQEAYRDLVPREYLDRVSLGDREVRWRDRLVSGTRRIALAESCNAVVGVVSWGERIEPCAPALELMSLYVGAGHRGSGVAAALLEVAIGDAPACLWVFEKNPRAQAFYAKQGFLFDGHRKVDPDTGLWERRFVRR